VGAKEGSSSKKTNVFLVDDHPIVREGFASLINKQPDFHVCGQSTSADATSQIADAHPEVVVIDVTLRGAAGINFIKNLVALDPQLAILILSAQDELLYAERALRAGARGYIMKLAPVSEILNAMRKAINGKRYLSPTMQEILVDRLAGTASASQQSLDRLSDREMEVFQLIATGRNTREIAEHLKLSAKTIETYRANIKEKLKLRNGIDLVRAAVAMVAEPA